MQDDSAAIIEQMNHAGKPKFVWTNVSGVRFFCCFVAAAAIFAFWLHAPYLEIELPRLEWWKIAGLYFSDFLAVLWFLRVLLIYAVLGQAPRISTPRLQQKSFRLFVIAGTAALLIDAGFTLFLLRNEKVRYDHGTIVPAEIIAKSVHIREVATWYDLVCKFTDTSGGRRQARVRLEVQNHVLSPALPRETFEVIQSPFRPTQTIALRYDPQFPARAWINGAGSDDGQRIYWFSFLTLFFQALLTLLFFLLTKQKARISTSPWWWDIYKTLPFAVEVFWVLTLGLIDRMMDRIS